ncbi:hypothetical protein BCV72DRAFT_236038 [Rhizopus microsporus var. microsporus]|nr:hypothetical protein BCV72DRAFT_236038 [Rhizopus microsporus var. microsporus]
MNIWRKVIISLVLTLTTSVARKKGKSAFNEKSKSNDKCAQVVTCTPQTMLHRTLQYEDFITSLLEERRDIILGSFAWSFWS